MTKMLLAALAVLELHGTPYERGLAHGKALKTEIARHVGKWKTSIAEEAKADADATVVRFLSDTHFKEAARKWTPDLLEEIRGIADGSGQPYDTIFALQLLDELWVWLDKRDGEHCSGVGASERGGKPAFVAQNMDLEGFRDGSQALLHIAGDAGTPEQYVFTAAGVVALDGLNAAGVGLVVNTLDQLKASKDGLPVAFVIRGVLARGRAEDALAFVKDVHHASGQNYLLGAGGRVHDFEASANKVAEAMPGADVVWHTNHPIANDDLRPWYVEWTKKQGADAEQANSRVRFRAMETRFKERAKDASPEDAKSALRSKDSQKDPVCRAFTSDPSVYTFGSVVMTLTGSPVLEVTAGPPDQSPYRRFEMKGTRP